MDDKNIQLEEPLPVEQTHQRENTVKQKIHEQIITSSPPFPERLIIPCPIEYPDFDLLGELKKSLCKNTTPPGYTRHSNLCKNH